jgi:tetratricopeptide (TPR) repeat protein
MMREQAYKLVRDGEYSSALKLLNNMIESDPSDWNSIYLAGQCCRHLGDIGGAISRLKRATEICPNESPVWLGLGIAHQLRSNWNEAISAIKIALEIDPDYVLAFNSLAFTQRKMNELAKAEHNYDAGIKALARCIIKNMENTFDGEIVPSRLTKSELWVEHVMYAALYIAANDENVGSIAWPNGKMAEEEEQTNKSGGLFWVDHIGQDGKLVRLFLPNFFNTFQYQLRRDRIYSELLGNRAMVLEMLGKQEEADAHFCEADEFGLAE